jgi:hypothetical protein
MKNIKLSIAIALFGIFLFPVQINADTGEEKSMNDGIETIKTEEVLNVQFEALMARLREIDEMDKSDLSRSEKRELRKEVREIEKTLNSRGGGVYLSVGALIIVILLLILLL